MATTEERLEALEDGLVGTRASISVLRSDTKHIGYVGVGELDNLAIEIRTLKSKLVASRLENTKAIDQLRREITTRFKTVIEYDGLARTVRNLSDGINEVLIDPLHQKIDTKVAGLTAELEVVKGISSRSVSEAQNVLLGETSFYGAKS